MDLARKKCIPCEGGVPPLSDTHENDLLPFVPGWQLSRKEPHCIDRIFSFGTFAEAIAFINKVALVSEEEGHHPDLHIFRYRHVRLTLHTHAISGLSENDFILAAKINLIELPPM